MLELSDAKLELVQIVARNEVQILDEAPQEPDRLLPRARPGAAHTRRQLAQQLLEDLDDPGVSGHARAASCAGAGAASARAAPSSCGAARRARGPTTVGRTRASS
jgi:hypothetical protein